MNLRYLLLAVVSILFVHFAYAQVQVIDSDEAVPGRTDTTNTYGRYRFPHVQYKNQSISKAINTDLLWNVLFIPKDSVKPTFLENIQFDEGFTSRTLTYTNYDVNFNQGNIFSVSIQNERCIAGCNENTVHFNYDIRSGKPIEMDSIFTQAGIKLISLGIADSQRREITAHIQFLAKTKTIDDEPAEYKREAIEMYNRCLDNHEKEYTGTERIEYNHDFIITPSVITIFRSRCSDPVSRALDELGEFEYKLNVDAYRKYLSPYGLSLFNFKK